MTNAELIAWLRYERRLFQPREWLRATEAAAAALEAADERIAELDGLLAFVARAIGHDPARTPELTVALSERLDGDSERIAALESALRSIDADYVASGLTSGCETARAALKEQTP